jgi:PAS domain S-box-containing protein
LFQAIEQSPASVMITDVEGRIEYVNPKFTETTGYTYPEVVGKRPGFLKSGQTSPEEYAELWKVISSGQVWCGEFSNRRKNGELFWELASIAPVRDGRGKVTHYVAVKEDISERKATEERLRHAQRMETIGQITGGIAHDFNNLLAIILGNLQLLEERSGDDKEGRELIADAIWSAERGAQLTHRLLAFARRQRLNPRVVNLNLVVEEMTGLLRRTLGERIDIREDLAPGVGQTMIDRGQLENALLNLVVNARDAMPAGGVLTIATGTGSLPPDLQTKGEEVAPGEYVVLTVTDTGVGMPPEVLERAFEPFFTTKKFGEGSGLGLSMVYGFVRQSGGTITMDSQPGRGTVVRLYLPRTPDAPDNEEHRSTGTGKENAKREEVILVVEDDTRVRKTAANILRRHGYTVMEASDADEALQLVDRLSRLDLLFTDLVLANGIDGAELAHQVLRRRPNTRVLLTSGYAEQVPAIESVTAEGIDLLPKPYRRNELTRRVSELLDRKSC